MTSIIFGGIYKANSKVSRYFPAFTNYLNDQKYNYWFPIRVVKDGIDKTYMIDTYQFEMDYKYQSNYEKMVTFLKSLGNAEDNSWLASKPFDYYYSARVQITEESIEAFDLIANLEDYEIASQDETRYYNKEDVVNGVMFWNYHKNGIGVNIKKKSAKLRYDLKIDALINDVLYDIRVPKIYDYNIEKLLLVEKEAIKENAIYDANKVEYLLKLQKYINRMSVDYDRYLEKLKAELANEANEAQEGEMK